MYSSTKIFCLIIFALISAVSFSQADLDVTKTVSDPNPAIGDIITYTINVVNNGPDKANNITIQDVLDTNLIFQSSAKSQGDNYDDGLGQWFVNDMNSGVTATLTITVQVGPGALNTAIANTASVLSVVESDPDSSNNSDTVYIGVGSADLQINKTVDNSLKNENDSVIYTIQATNISLATDADAFFTTVTDLLPDGVTYVSDDSAISGTTYNSITGVWDAGTILKTQTITLKITCTVNANTGGSTITNTATVTSAMVDPDTTNNTDTASFQVHGADLAVTNVVDNGFPTELDLITYTVTIINNGPDDTTGVIANDLLPFNVTYQSHTSSQGVYNYVTGNWNIGNINIGASVTLTIVTQVRISGAFTNTATITGSSQPDSATANNSGSIRVSAQEIFIAGAAIIDMGVTPQTYNNGLIPYGLVYDLAINNNIPVYWIVNHTKSWVNPSSKQDQTDITVNGKAYKGGPFVIPSEFMTDALPIINTWVSNYSGLTVDTGLPEFAAPIYDYITSFPVAVLDQANGDKVQDAFYDRANVPTTFGRLGTPDDLTLCDDIYTMPHSDPQDWSAATVNTLIDFIENGGYFWAACHAVSAMEGLVDIDSDGNPDLNLLSNNGLIEWGDHNDGTPPYSYNTEISILNGSETAGDPLMQFMGTMDGAIQGGSEAIYIPDVAGWRDTTVLALTDDDHPEVIDGTYPTGPAVALAYGRAFGDDSNGLVMYEASHSIASGSEAENTAAARVYGNFLLQAGIERRPKIKIDLLPSYNPNDENITFNGDVGGIAPPFTYAWTDNCGGTFDDASILNTTYTPDDTVDSQTCLLTLVVTDNCGRRNFTSFPVVFELDTDDDGLANSLDFDDDNDGIPDVIEENGDTSRDTDNDGVLDRIDLDADGDGILDMVEGGLSTTQIAFFDTDNDGYIDSSFSFGGNGLIDDLEISTESGTVDYDGNGLEDDFANSDSDIYSNFQDIDADNDGIPDNVELQTTTGYIAPDTIFDDFGINNSYLAGMVLTDTDSDGIPDYLDTDSDADGTQDIQENGMANTISGNDTDSDGLDNAFEGSNLNDIDTNDEINTPSSSVLPDTDGDQAIGGDLDYRDIFDINPPSSATIDFDGLDDYVDSNLDLSGYEQATIMVWVKLDLAFSNTASIINQGDFEIQISSSNVISISLNGSTTTLPDSTVLNNNEWTHISLIYNRSLPSNKLKVYVNGNLEASSSDGALSSAVNTSTDAFTIGKKSSTNSNYFKGNIDEVRVLNVSLSEDQLHKIIHQEIEENSGSVSGIAVLKTIVDISTSLTIPWANLNAYYPMTDILNTKTSDFSGKGNTATLHNITTVQAQTAPMPYQTKADGDWSLATSWLNGDVCNLDALTNSGYSIAKINHDVYTNSSVKTLGLLLDSNKTLTVNGDNEIKNSWYLGLDGTLDLQNDSQLVQGIQSDLVTSVNGKILRRQEGSANVFWYNYWSSPIGSQSATSYLDNNTSGNNPNNSAFNIDMLKDGTATDIQFTNAYNEIGKLSTTWFYTFQNGTTYWDWHSYTAATPISPGVGYIHKGTGNTGTEQKYTFEGKPNNGTILVNVTDVGGSGSVPSVSKTNYLLGNPYPSAIDIHKFIDDNDEVIGGDLLLWQQWSGNSHYLNEYNGGYATVNKSGSTKAYQFIGLDGANNSSLDGTLKPTRYLPVGQGFITEIIEDGNVVFNNSQRLFIKETDANGDYNNGSVFFRSSNTSSETETDEMSTIRLEFKAIDGPSRELLLGFSNITSDEYDYGYDAINFDDLHEDDLNLSFGDDKMTIQAYSQIAQEKVISLMFKASGNYVYEIKVSEIYNIAEDHEIYLADRFIGTYFNLRNEQGYSFTSDAGEFADRFDVIFKSRNILSNQDFTTDNTLIYANNVEDKLYVKGLDQDVKKLTITNILGQTIKTYIDLEREVVENGLSLNHLSSGVYIVNIETESKKDSKKVIIN